MITVVININGNTLAARSCRNVGEYQNGDNIYRTDSGRDIRHKQSYGAIKLAHLLLDDIEV